MKYKTQAIHALIWVLFLKLSGTIVDIEGESIVLESQNERFHLTVPAELRKEKLQVGDHVTVSVPIQEGTAVHTLKKEESAGQAPGVAPSSKPVLDDRIAFPA